MSNPLSTGQQHIPLFEYMPTHEHHYRFPFHFIRIFTPPELRVKWGKNHDEHPIVDWGELFYDLFFVAAAFNLGTIIKSASSPLGILYFLGTGWPVMNLWFDKLYYDARFLVHDDGYHRFVKLAQYVLLATAVQHVSPAIVLRQTSEYGDMLAFSVAIALSNILTVVQYLEIYHALLDDGARAVAFRNVLYKILPIIFYTSAAIAAGISFYGSVTLSNENVPIILCLVGGASDKLSKMWTIRIRAKNALEQDVEVNMDFIIHRLGEWTMLILGEAILSLLIVEVVHDALFYVTFYAGILSVILLEYLHFRSQPHHGEEHAMRKSVPTAYLFTIFMQGYSAALIMLGVSYKLLLTEFLYDDDDASITHAAPDGLSTEQRRRAIAHIFGGSMSVVWACLDGMMLLHKSPLHVSSRLTPGGALFLACRVGMILFSATLSQWCSTDPPVIAVIGLGVCVIQLLLRIIGGVTFRDARIMELLRLDHNNSKADVVGTTTTGENQQVEEAIP